MSTKKNTLLWSIAGVIVGMLLSLILYHLGIPNMVTLLLEAIFG